LGKEKRGQAPDKSHLINIPQRKKLIEDKVDKIPTK
jgi:hypothetical protein